MKKITKIIAAALLPAMLLSLSACSENTTTGISATSSAVGGASQTAEEPSAITNKIMQDIKFPSMAEISADRLASYYDINADSIESFSAYLCGSGAFPDEIAIFKMKTSDDVQTAKAVLDARIDYQTKTFKDYTPDEMYKIDGNNVIINGNYIALIICSDNASAIKTFKSMSK